MVIGVSAFVCFGRVVISLAIWSAGIPWYGVSGFIAPWHCYWVLVGVGDVRRKGTGGGDLLTSVASPFGWATDILWYGIYGFLAPWLYY